MLKNKKLILFGDSAFAEIAYEYFTFDSEYEIVAFTVSKEFLSKKELFGLPIIAFEEIEEQFPPTKFEMHIALVYNSLNRIRRQFYFEAKEKGYHLANYISTKSFIWRNVELGDNIFIFEDNTIQPFVKIASNNVFWSGNHIGHHSEIGSHNFFSSHVVISGYCTIGNSNFLGVNSTINNNLQIGDDCIIGSGSLIVKSTFSGSIVKGILSQIETIQTWDKLNIQRLDEN
jgi:sugar O-acyltransferase (sialic acid O-acetyltransferase NeuD family)